MYISVHLCTHPAISAERGIASVYCNPHCQGGNKAANGERIDRQAFTAAHRTLPFGTIALVKNIRNGRSTFVRINDRGPFKHGRIIDLTPAAARAIGSNGLAHVEVTRAEKIGTGADQKQADRRADKERIREAPRI